MLDEARHYGGCFDKPLAIPFPVFLTRSGIPRCIPVFHRRMIKRRDAKTDQLVRDPSPLIILTFKMHLNTQEKTNFEFESIVKPPAVACSSRIINRL